MYYPLHDIKSLMVVLREMGHTYIRPTSDEFGSWVAKTLTVARNFLDTAVFEKLLAGVDVRALFGHVYDPIGIAIPVILVGKSSLSSNDVYDVLLIGGKFSNLVQLFLLVAYDRSILKLKTYEIDESAWTNTLFKEPVFLELKDGFYVDLNQTLISETAVPTERIPLVFKNEVEVKLEEPESPPKPNEKQPFNVNVLFAVGGIIFLIVLALRGR